MYFFERSILKVPLFIYSSLYFCLSVGSITVYIMGVYLRINSIADFLKLRLLLKSLLFRGNMLVIKSKDQQDDVEVISTLMDIYNDILDTCDEINICFGFQLMIAFGIIFFYTLFTTFTAYTDLINDGCLTPSTICSTIFCIYFNLALASIIFYCILMESSVSHN